ncbi:DUF4269 domain-containing protein [Flavobacterium johnsoniae]|uniref:DUF4269 domain-containing protein n=1 Tax=Flavobacterium johnsoniae TaxID=986 RepID=A0A1M5QTY7_FLAJO|nr:DUF4269 domain-containing protein [Flavobacterium johnsoniae]SHH17428.1 protein of unknown function [Flavobacterium johnsoniae]
MNFDNIEYLQRGNKRQQQAYSTLTNNQILVKLKYFDPILVGTIPIDIDIESSDLDIVCCFADKQEFIITITDSFRNEGNFTIREQKSISDFSIVANFFVDNFEIEIFGQSTPTRQQFAYRHLIVENYLLNKYGEKFRQQIIELKRQGHKTEPAFAIALELTGDPYTELLKYETEDKSPNR